MMSPPFHPLNPGYGRNSTIHRTLIQSIYSLLENVTLDLKGIDTKLAMQLSPQKAIPGSYQASCFKIVGNMIKPVNSMNTVPFAKKRIP